MSDVEPVTRQTDEFDVPLAQLPQAGGLQLTQRRHIEGVSAEIRFATASTHLAESVAARIWKALGGSSVYPVFEPASMGAHNVMVTPQGMQTHTESMSGWRLSTPDGARSLVLFPSLISLQTSAYTRYSSDLGEPLLQALQAFSETTEVGVVNRIGLRYINRLTDTEAATPQFWAHRVRDSFAGALGDEYLAPLIAMAHQQVELRLDETAGARVICGAFEQDDVAAGRYGFVIDLDVFRNDAIAFEVDRVSNLTRQLNRTALSLFMRVVSDDTQASLGPISTSGGVR